MLGFVRQLMPYHGLPIGVDLGESTIRLAQIELVENEYRLIHASETTIQPTTDPSQRSVAVTTALKTALRAGGFRGRKVALGLSAANVQVKHLRMPRSAGEEFNATVKDQAASSLNIDVNAHLLRAIVAGEVFGEQSPQQEVLLFATPHDVIQQLLDDAASARVEIVGVHVQPRVTADLFAQLYRRKSDEDAVNLFVDLGATGTRAFVAAPAELRFVRTMPVNVADLHGRIARQMSMKPDEVGMLRRSLIAQQTGRSNDIAAGEPTVTAAQQRLQDETNRAAATLADELEMCKRYYEATFPNKPVTRLIFIGGGARDRLLCASIAQAMSLPAQIGDPLIRFNRSSLPAIACIDRRDALPHWSVAIGLSMCGQTVAHV